MWLTLLVDRDGEVVAAGGPGAKALDVKPGQPCQSVLAARDDRGRRWCTERCATALAQGCAPDRSLPHAVTSEQSFTLECTRVGNQVVVVATPSAGEAPKVRLTGREREVLDAFAAGLTTVEVAARLGIGPGTVRTHVERLRRKLRARTIAEAVARGR